MSGTLTRRALLALTLAGAGVAVGVVTPAAAASAQVDGLSFDVPDVMSAVPNVPGVGSGWQWEGLVPGSNAASPPRLVVLARADVHSSSPEEVLALLLAGTSAGQLPHVLVEPGRARSMPGGGLQTRVEIAYGSSAATRLHGSLLVATRPGRPAGVLVVLGDDALTAGQVSGVLDSARWES